MERVETITRIEAKELPGKDGGDPRTLYLIFDGEGREYSTTYRDLARVAHEAKDNGRHVRLGFEEKRAGQYGQFTNRYLQEIQLVNDDGLGGAVGKAMSDAQAAQQSRPASLFDDTEPEAASYSQTATIDRDAERQHLIVNQSSLTRALETLPYLPQEERTVSNVTTIAEYYAIWVWTFRAQVRP